MNPGRVECAACLMSMRRFTIIRALCVFVKGVRGISCEKGKRRAIGEKDMKNVRVIAGKGKDSFPRCGEGRQRWRFFAAAGIKKKRLTRRARTDILRAEKRREAAAGLTEVESTTCRAGVVTADRLGTGMSGRSAFLRCRLLASSLTLGAFVLLRFPLRPCIIEG